MIECFSSGRPWEERFKYSRAVMFGPLFKTCLTSPSDASGAILHPGSVRMQTQRCMEIIGETLAQAGMSFANVVSSNIYMLDTSLWEQAAEVHAGFVGEARPTLSFLGLANFFDPEILVEVEVMAYDPRRAFPQPDQ